MPPVQDAGTQTYRREHEAPEAPQLESHRSTGRRGGGRISPEEAAELVRAAAEGSEAAWNRLVDGFLPMLWSAVKQYRLSPSDAADVIQTTWLRLVQNLHRLENPAGVGGYLVVTVRREALRVSGQGKQTYATDNLHVLDRIDLDAPPCDASMLSAERDAVVRELFLELPE